MMISCLGVLFHQHGENISINFTDTVMAYPIVMYCSSNELVSIWTVPSVAITLQWRHNGRDGVSSHQPRDCLLYCLFRHRSEKTPKLHVTGLCVGNSLVTGEFPTQMASNAENVSIWWRHHDNHISYHTILHTNSWERANMELTINTP